MSGKRKSMLIAIIASLVVIVVGSVSVTYGWFLSRGSSEYGFVLKADDHVILRYETDLNFANSGTSADEENCLVPAVAELTFGLDQREYEPIDMFDPSAVETVATAAHFRTKAAYWTGSVVDKGELGLKVTATVKGGSSAYDLVEWGEIDYIAIFSYLWDGADATKKVLYYDGEWYSDIETAASPFIVPLSVTGNQALTTWYVLNDTNKVKVSNGIKYLLMSPNREFELDLYAFVAKTDELLDPAINGKTISLSATLNDMTAFVDLGDNTIKFGSYPQTLVINTQIQRKLNDLAGALPANGANGNWTSYKYYISQSNETDYMWYIDLVFRGERYRGVYFDHYRPQNAFNGASAYWATDQDDLGFYPLNVYWFKFEAIQWHILSDANGAAFLFAEKVLDAQAFQIFYKVVDDVYYNTSEGTPEGIYANNYKYSTLRAWLNGTFYNAAFNDDQKALILTTTLDNSVISTNPYNEPNRWSNTYLCENTSDKVFPLSRQEITTPAYGFGSSMWDQGAPRAKQPTDYAKSQGVWIYGESSNETDSQSIGYASFWGRSAHFENSGQALRVYPSGNVRSGYAVYYSHPGVVPAVRINRS